MTQIRSATAAELSQKISHGAKTLPTAAVRMMFLEIYIVVATLQPDLIEPLALPLTDVIVHGDGTATGNFAQPQDLPNIPVKFIDQNGWKIDSVGSPESLQNAVLQLFLWTSGSSIHSAVVALQQSTNPERFSDAAFCFTEDARDEWIGEMLVAIADRQSLGGNVIGRWKDFATDRSDNLSQEMMATFFAHQPGLMENIRGYLEQPEIDAVLCDPAADRAARRAACIQLVQKLDSRNALLGKLLETRHRIKPGSSQVAGSSSDVKITADPKAMIAVLFTRDKSASPITLHCLQIDGLWKLNTIIDPALKPWPLPAEEPTPPAEATPVDGAK
jgi:hypothetical protein